MPKAYIQLGASGSSPSICPARATGCQGKSGRFKIVENQSSINIHHVYFFVFYISSFVNCRTIEFFFFPWKGHQIIFILSLFSNRTSWTMIMDKAGTADHPVVALLLEANLVLADVEEVAGDGGQEDPRSPEKPNKHPHHQDVRHLRVDGITDPDPDREDEDPKFWRNPSGGGMVEIAATFSLLPLDQDALEEPLSPLENY